VHKMRGFARNNGRIFTRHLPKKFNAGGHLAVTGP